jgi:xanthine permease XanQ
VGIYFTNSDDQIYFKRSEGMSDINHAGSDLIFELEDRPPFHQALVGAITHLLALFVPMVTPALIVGAALQLSAETTAYLVSMAISPPRQWFPAAPFRGKSISPD